MNYILLTGLPQNSSTAIAEDDGLLHCHVGQLRRGKCSYAKAVLNAGDCCVECVHTCMSIYYGQMARNVKSTTLSMHLYVGVYICKDARTDHIYII